MQSLQRDTNQKIIVQVSVRFLNFMRSGFIIVLLGSKVTRAFYNSRAFKLGVVHLETT